MRNPASVLETLRNQQRAFDGRALDRFLARHIGDARRFKQQVLDQQYEALKKSARADYVPSGWRMARIGICPFTSSKALIKPRILAVLQGSSSGPKFVLRYLVT